MSGTPQESSFSQADAVNLLLNAQAPEQASEDVQEQNAETTEVEASVTEEVEVEAADDSQADTEAEEVEESSEDIETVDSYAVKIDGEDGEATIDELINSYQLRKTAQKRLEEVSVQRKAVEAERASTEQARQQYEQALNMLAAQIQQSYAPKDQAHWDALFESDPLEYVRQRDQERDAQTKAQAVQAEQLRLRQVKLAEEQKRLLELVPEWKDPEVEAREKAAIVTYAQSKGFTSQELGNAIDSKYVDLMRKAYLYDNLQSQKPIAAKKVKTAPKMVKSGQPKTKGDSATERKRKAFDKLKKSGTKEDAVQFMLTR